MKILHIVCTGVAMAIASPALAQEDPCAGFTWPVGPELALMRGEADPVQSGTTIAMPSRSVALALRPAQSANLPYTPSTKKEPSPSPSYSGWFTIARVPQAGVYQVSLSSEGWIDVSQNGVLAKPLSFTGRHDCLLRKSVRFEIGSGPVLIGVSGAPKDAVKITVRPAEPAVPSP